MKKSLVETAVKRIVPELAAKEMSTDPKLVKLMDDIISEYCKTSQDEIQMRYIFKAIWEDGRAEGIARSLKYLEDKAKKR